jgi:AraC-like DNA-binding protein
MESTGYKPAGEISLFVRNILVFEEKENPAGTILPFFADGYPGLMFHMTPNGLWVQPQNKKMPSTFLHGQTLHPIELHMSGDYKLITFQLYPFVINSFFGVNAKELNDDCFDLLQIESWNDYNRALQNSTDTNTQVDIISKFLLQLFHIHKQNLDFKVKESLELILDKKAQIGVGELCKQLHVNVRTFERRFIKEVGISAKNFIQITRFQQSLEQLSVKDFGKLTDIVYSNGFADQSHFIRVFKAFTGKTPSTFIKT